MWSVLLLIILVVVWWSNTTTESVYYTSRAFRLCEHVQLNPRPNLHVYTTTGASRTEGNRDIYLQITNQDGTPHDPNSIMGVLCHELAHVVTPGTSHGPDFQEWESRFLQGATELGWYDPQQGIASNYPCQV